MLSDQVPSKSIPVNKPQIFMIYVSKLYISFLCSDSIFFTPVYADIRFWILACNDCRGRGEVAIISLLSASSNNESFSEVSGEFRVLQTFWILSRYHHSYCQDWGHYLTFI